MNLYKISAWIMVIHTVIFQGMIPRIHEKTIVEMPWPPAKCPDHKESAWIPGHGSKQVALIERLAWLLIESGFNHEMSIFIRKNMYLHLKNQVYLKFNQQKWWICTWTTVLKWESVAWPWFHSAIPVETWWAFLFLCVTRCVINNQMKRAQKRWYQDIKISRYIYM